MKNRYLYITLLALLGLTPEALAQQQKEKIQYAPRLVVNICIDQLRTDYMEAFAPLYSNDGFKRLLKEGLVYTNATYPFSSIDRASAISSVMTGVVPYYHSIVSERWLDKETLRPVYCVGDLQDSSPKYLQTSTIGDELKVSTDGKAIVYAIAPFRDAAVLSAGHAADGALWVDDVTGLWVSSQYYLKQLPVWLQAFNSQQSPQKVLAKTAWEPVIPLSGTFSYFHHEGNQKPFKHKFTGQQRYAQYKASGLVNQAVTDMAVECVNGATMGFDRVTDLLCLTYYAGNFAHKTMT